jgi:hypothetical protein
MLAVLTYKDGKTKNVNVPDPAPQDWKMPAPFDINSIGLKSEESDEGKLVTASPETIRFILAGTESGVAEYFEEGLPEAQSAYYEKTDSYLKNKEAMEDIVRQFKDDYPDCKKFQEGISELGSKMVPHEGEDPYTFLKRVYNAYMLARKAKIDHSEKVEQQKQAIAIQNVAAAQDKVNDAQKMMKDLQAQYASMAGYAAPVPSYVTSSQVGPTTYGYQPGYLSSPEGFAGPPSSGVQSATPVPKKKEKEIPEPELPKSRMIVLKKQD